MNDEYSLYNKVVNMHIRVNNENFQLQRVHDI